MEIGIVRERGGGGCDKRAVLLPSEVGKLVNSGHTVYVETGTGQGLQISDEEYGQAGAVIVAKPNEAMCRDLIVKLKAPTEAEASMMKNNAIVLTMLHAEQSPHNAEVLAGVGAVGVSMELICNEFGERYVDCTDLTGEQGMIFAFCLFGKSPSECKVLVMGYGRVSTGAITTASKLGANVRVLRKGQYAQVGHYLEGIDILVNGIAWPKEERDRKHYVVTRDMLKLMNRPGMIVDLSVDYPSPIETCHPTDMKNPIFEVDGIVHMDIYGYPALAPLSSSKRYSRQLLPIILEIASKGLNNVGLHIANAVVDWRQKNQKGTRN